MLSNQYNLSMNEPNIQIYNVDVRGNRSITLRHTPHNRDTLADSKSEVLKHLHRLWGFDVNLETLDESGKPYILESVPPKKEVEKTKV